MQQRLKKSFRNKILQSLAALTLIPLLGWGLLSYQRAMQNHTESFEQQLRESAEDLRLQVDLWHANNLELLHFLVREIATRPRKEWHALLQNIVATEPTMFTMIDDVSGSNIVRSDEKTFRNYADREYFRRALEGEFFSEVIIARNYGKPTLCSAGPVVQKQMVRQVVVLCSFMDRINDSFARARLGKTGRLFLVDDSGRVLSHPDVGFEETAKARSDRNAIERAQKGASGRLDLREGDEEYVGYIAPLSNGWKVIAVQSRREIADLSQRSLMWPFLTGIVGIVLLVLLNSFFVDRTTAPLHRLTRVVRKFGQGDLAARAPVESNDELGVLAVSFNLMATQIRGTIEELKGKEAQLAKSRDELHQKVGQQSQKLLYSAKMSSLGEMAGGIAHEVNNPLAIISLKAQRIQEGLATGRLRPQEAIELSAQIEATCMRINKIIRGLKTFSRDGSRDPMVSESLQTILTDTENLCGESLRARGIRLHIDCPPELRIECQPVQLSQLFLNLIMNSRDAVANLSEKWIRIEAIVEGEGVLVKVTDSGRGIPEPVRSQMMQPFYTTKGVGEGTGLGLSICKGIIEHHQGSFVYNLDSDRTQFLIHLPLYQKRLHAPSRGGGFVSSRVSHPEDLPPFH